MNLDWMILKRVFVGGGKNFMRGGAVSAATVLVMTVTLTIIASLIFLSSLLTYTLNMIKDEVNVTVYFVTSAEEASIFAVRDQLEKLPQVASVTYATREEELTAFRAKYADDQTTLQSLDVLGSNPFGASLTVVAKDTSQYEGIAKFLEASPTLSAGGTSIVEKINYDAKNKESIDRLTFIIKATRQLGFAIIIFFVLASIMIAFATIRLAIYTSKDEIAVMKLVGASNSYVQAPFIVEGVITGTVSALLVLILLWPVTWYVGMKTANYFLGFNLGQYYASHFFFVFGILMISGIFLGGVASIFAIRKYLRV